MDFEYKYNQLSTAVNKMLTAQADARKNKTIQSKWVIANQREAEVRELLKPKEEKIKQATFNWLAQ